MPEVASSTLFEQFLNVPATPQSGLSACPGASVSEALEHVACLLSDLDFLGRVDRQDASLAEHFRRPGFARDVQDAFQRVEEQLGQLTRPLLASVRELRNAGTLGNGFARWRKALAQHGPTDLSNIVDEVFEQQHVAKQLEHPLGQQVLGNLRAQLERADLKAMVAAQGDDLAFSIDRGGDVEQFTLVFPQKLPLTVTQLFYGDWVDSALAALARGELVNAVFTDRGHQANHRELELDAALLAIGLLPIQAAHQEARIAEDAGMPAYQGGDGGASAGLIVGLVILIIGVVVAAVGAGLLIACAAGERDLCEAGLWVLIAGLVVAVIGVSVLGCVYSGCTAEVTLAMSVVSAAAII